MRNKFILSIFLLIVLLGVTSAVYAKRATELIIKNKCYKPINVAIYYKDSDGHWIVEGWFNILNYRAYYCCCLPCIARFTGSTFYLYAETNDGDIWGAKEDCVIYLSVRGSSKKYRFYKVKMRRYNATLEYSFICNELD